MRSRRMIPTYIPIFERQTQRNPSKVTNMIQHQSVKWYGSVIVITTAFCISASPSLPFCITHRPHSLHCPLYTTLPIRYPNFPSTRSLALPDWTLTTSIVQTNLFSILPPLITQPTIPEENRGISKTNSTSMK